MKHATFADCTSALLEETQPVLVLTKMTRPKKYGLAPDADEADEQWARG